MIILVTGTPGAGKTLYTVSQLLNGQFKDRPLYVNNIPNLLLEHQVFSGDGDEPDEDSDVFHWFDGRVEKNGVICIDEAQRVFRPRSATAAVPPYIAKLETHRHLGLDIILITQHPQLIHANVRRLVGRHIHVRRAWGMPASIIYEWDSCSTNVHAVKQSQSKIFRFKKEDYKLYKSSELHTKAGGRVPMIIKFAILLLIIAPIFWYFTYVRVKEKFNPETHKTEVQEKMNLQPSGNSSNGKQEQPLTPQEYLDTLRPRIEYLKHTAVRYDELTQPVRVPVPSACMKMAKRCECYTQDGTPYKTNDELCNYLVDNGMFYDFNPEQQQENNNLAQVPQPIPQPIPQIMPKN